MGKVKGIIDVHRPVIALGGRHTGKLALVPIQFGNVAFGNILPFPWGIRHKANAINAGRTVFVRAVVETIRF